MIPQNSAVSKAVVDQSRVLEQPQPLFVGIPADRQLPPCLLNPVSFLLSAEPKLPTSLLFVPDSL